MRKELGVHVKVSDLYEPHEIKKNISKEELESSQKKIADHFNKFLKELK